MSGRARVVRFLIAGSIVAVAVPGAALAGKKVTSGQQTLQIKTSLSSNRPGARHVKFGLHYDYRSPTPGVQPPYNTKSITLVMPAGMVLNPAAAPACKRSQIDKAGGDVSTCPSRTIVGHGTVVVNGAPTIPAPITGTVTIYNGVNNVGADQPKGTRNLILWIKTSLGVNRAVPFRVMKGRREKLVASFPKPSQPGVAPGDVTIQSVTLSTKGSGRRSYINNPRACSGSWSFALKVANYFSQPSITAHDKLRCRA